MIKILKILLVGVFMLGVIGCAKNKVYRYDKSPCKPKKNKSSFNQIENKEKDLLARGQNIFIECDKKI